MNRKIKTITGRDNSGRSYIRQHLDGYSIDSRYKTFDTNPYLSDPIVIGVLRSVISGEMTSDAAVSKLNGLLTIPELPGNQQWTVARLAMLVDKYKNLLRKDEQYNSAKNKAMVERDRAYAAAAKKQVVQAGIQNIGRGKYLRHAYSGGINMRKAYPNEIFHSSSPVVYRGKNYDKTAENYLKNSGSAEEQRAMSAIIDKIDDVATKSMLRQASSDSILAWCTSRLKRVQQDIAADAETRRRLHSRNSDVRIQPKDVDVMHWRISGLSEEDLSKLMGYARKGLTYGRRPTYAEPDYQRAKIAAENDRYNRTYNTARMQTNANRRRKLTMGGRKDKA